MNILTTLRSISANGRSFFNYETPLARMLTKFQVAQKAFKNGGSLYFDKEQPPSMPKRSVTADKRRSSCSLRFDPVALESIFDVLDAIAWMSNATSIKIAQFTSMDPRTVGKV